jgi:hypothetical protein
MKQDRSGCTHKSKLVLALGVGLGASLAALPLHADAAPPAGALPLSQVIALLEVEGGIAYIDEVEWDDDGYWEVDYVTSDGRKVEVRLDPLTGSPRR